MSSGLEKDPVSFRDQAAAMYEKVRWGNQSGKTQGIIITVSSVAAIGAVVTLLATLVPHSAWHTAGDALQNHVLVPIKDFGLRMLDLAKDHEEILKWVGIGTASVVGTGLLGFGGYKGHQYVKNLDFGKGIENLKLNPSDLPLDE